ncbi:MAG: hypothetical protein AAB581_03865 [Patescibacteria group bacterium]
MFHDIKKLLARVKRGIVIVEDGEPSFVVIPFEDFAERMRDDEGMHSRAFMRQRPHARRHPIDDTSLIQKMIDYDATVRTQDFTKEAEAMELLNRIDEEKESGTGRHARINLEDLPF